MCDIMRDREWTAQLDYLFFKKNKTDRQEAKVQCKKKHKRRKQD